MDDLLKLMHDTMTPVAAIKGAIELLQSGKMKPDETARLLSIIDLKAEQLNKILDAYYLKTREKEKSEKLDNQSDL